ncbi:hypothetical protein AGABI1DRAFT_87199 [Agaricus bisporus var. burnettii JB137-S8]|uniref:SMP domain-containing protein n=2 Tax=Agaricus bisporus var. burnettii TaxID=192524 RepID=K5VPR0_AGABU|nr:uncharacterized protein AGABI1DRAFT_87199 [Agaricus bisporus var. burnettii JB137-S8]EKM76459.1 hypothetical protein AGABI1DRAFT_87199 [Agaricus bisporus var. burnettii JB137-S8]
MSSKTPMKPSDASRIQSSQAKGGKPVGSNSFASRSQSAGQTNVNKGVINPSGGTAKATPAASGKSGGARKFRPLSRVPRIVIIE